VASVDESLPLQLMDDAIKHVRQQKVQGSATACIVTVSRNNLLFARNLGDSGFMVIRPSAPAALQLVARSNEQQSSFNCPYQLAFESSNSHEPRDSDAYNVQLQAGDIVVLATDGLFDNLFDKQIVTIALDALGTASSPDEKPQHIADQLAKRAEDITTSQNDTPFAQSARRHGHRHSGGKPDDISVVVAIV